MQVIMLILGLCVFGGFCLGIGWSIGLHQGYEEGKNAAKG